MPIEHAIAVLRLALWLMEVSRNCCSVDKLITPSFFNNTFKRKRASREVQICLNRLLFVSSFVAYIEMFLSTPLSKLMTGFSHGFKTFTFYSLGLGLTLFPLTSSCPSIKISLLSAFATASSYCFLVTFFFGPFFAGAFFSSSNSQANGLRGVAAATDEAAEAAADDLAVDCADGDGGY